jgi:hypothetical protein
MDDEFSYVSSEQEYANHGFTTGSMNEEGGVTEDAGAFEEGELSLESGEDE